MQPVKNSSISRDQYDYSYEFRSPIHTSCNFHRRFILVNYQRELITLPLHRARESGKFKSVETLFKSFRITKRINSLCASRASKLLTLSYRPVSAGRVERRETISPFSLQCVQYLSRGTTRKKREKRTKRVDIAQRRAARLCRQGSPG